MSRSRPSADKPPRPSPVRARPSDRTAKKAAEATADKERRKRERAEKALVQQKATADRMRALPLPDVLDALGFQQDKAEPDRWKADGFNITLAQGPKLGKWFDHIAQHGRGGAIDLVQHITGADFKGALSGWPIGSEKAQPPPILRPVCAQKPCARSKRPRPSESLHRPLPYPGALAECGNTWWRIAPCPRPTSTSCISRATATPTPAATPSSFAGTLKAAPSARLKGTIQRSDGSRFSGMTPGSAKDAGGFRIGSIAKAAVIYLVESAIDAISLAKLRATAGRALRSSPLLEPRLTRALGWPASRTR